MFTSMTQLSTQLASIVRSKTTTKMLNPHRYFNPQLQQRDLRRREELREQVSSIINEMHENKDISTSEMESLKAISTKNPSVDVFNKQMDQLSSGFTINNFFMHPSINKDNFWDKIQQYTPRWFNLERAQNYIKDYNWTLPDNQKCLSQMAQLIINNPDFEDEPEPPNTDTKLAI
ncbi:MAG: hypothetical protein ACOYB0_11050, partial [Polynucleobacter sp.]